MTPTNKGSIRLFRFAGIDVFIHWSWFVVALYSINNRQDQYTSLIWNAAEYASLFVIVLMHEFGHSLACRQVGGQANQIVLWPLGGVAYVNPPQRPGATLWAIAAGPLVNLVLAPLAFGLLVASIRMGWDSSMPDLHRYLEALLYINIGLLIFNLMPVYPLDGGQILRSLLWFVVGRTRSLQISVIIGFLGGIGLMIYAISERSIWIGIMSFFILLRCYSALVQTRLETAAGRPGLSCPGCQAAPPAGAYWLCGQCRRPFDTFATGGVCPQCQAPYAVATCPRCGQAHPREAWLRPPPLNRTGDR